MGAAFCKPCPEGYECPTEGTYAPTVCAPGNYRSNNDPFYQAEDNVMCHPCPEGTWNWRGALTSSGECLVCPERYVCARQGMTVFATKDQTDCTPNTDGVQLCYALSQANDCPEGFACDAGTTSYTQYNYPCEPGYFCKSLTAPREMRNLLCPSGYSCKASTGYSKAYSLLCPAGYFCEEGTANIDTGAAVQVLYNVQAEFLDYYSGDGTVWTTDVNVTDSATGATCRRCDPNVFNPPFDVNTTDCLPCGELSGDGYIPVEAWVNLQCPDGTTSQEGSLAPSDCLQAGYVLAVVNIYDHSAVVNDARTATSTPLWDADREDKWVNDPTSSEYLQKTSLRFGQPISSSNTYIVDFLGFDPRADPQADVLWHFVSVRLDSLDIMSLVFDFSNVPSHMVMATSANSGGSYRISISSDKISQGFSDGVSTSYELPYTMAQSGGDLGGSVFTLRLLSLMDDVNVNVSLTLLDGSHYRDLHTFNDALSVEIQSPNKTEWRTQKAFYSLISATLLNQGGYELPYNMVPTFANQPGDISLVVDLGGQTNYTVDPTLQSTMVPGATFWQVAGASTAVMPWLPFFSNCDYFDKHVVLWDLLENNRLPPDAGECRLYNESEVRVVAPLIYDFSTGSVQFQSTSDFCELAFTCRYEDHLTYSGGDAIPWMSIPASTTLFYLTQNPLEFAGVASPDFKTSSGNLDSLEGTDALIPVTYDASQRTGKFPRLIHLEIDYAQLTQSTKRIISATMTLQNFDDDETRTDYVLQISWEPMNWISMMNAFQLPFYVYIMVFIMLGFSVVGAGLLAWGALQLISKSARIPPFQIVDSYTFFMGYAIQGIVVGSVPLLFVAGVIKLIQLPALGLFSGVPCAWTKGASSTSSVIIPGTDDDATCNAVRTGTCLILSGLFTLWSTSVYFTPRLPDVHRDYLLNASTSKLQDDGVYYPAKKKFGTSIVATVVRWKRVHFFFICVILCLPLMTVFSFSYSSMFGNFTTMYTVGYTLTMLIADLLFVKAAREKLTFGALAVVTDVVFFVATLSALDLNAFLSSFLFSQFFIIAQRCVAEGILGYIYEEAIPGISKWLRSRQFFWTILTSVSNVSRFVRHQTLLSTHKVEDISALKYADPTSTHHPGAKQHLVESNAVKGVANLNDGVDVSMGIAGRSSSLIFAPFAIVLLMIFPTETLFLVNYQLRLSDIPYYLMFSLLIVPFQIGLDIIINHGFDAARGTRIYDYMYLCQWRWRNRLTRWLLDDARLDSSLGQSSQALHHLAFSPQYYFIVTYSIYGGVFITYGITCWIAHGVPAFLDPTFGFYVVVMLLTQRVADAIARWLVFYVLWKPADKAPEKAFVQSIAMGLKQMELEEHQVAFRNFFFKRHRQWVIENLDKVYTPRGIERYRSQLSEIYQRVLSIRIPYLYTAPVKQPTVAAVEEPTDDSAEDIAKAVRKLNESDMYEVPLTEEDGDDGSAAIPTIVQSLVQGWFEIARRRARVNKMNKARFTGGLQIDTDIVDDEPAETYPDWLVVKLTNSSKEMMKQWVKQAKENVASRR